MKCYGMLCLVATSLIAFTKAPGPRGDMPILHYPIGAHPPCFHRNYVANANRIFAGNVQTHIMPLDRNRVYKVIQL